MGGSSKFLMLLSTPAPILHRRPTSSALRLARAALSSNRSFATLPRRRHLGFRFRASADQVHTLRDDHRENSLGVSSNASRASYHPWPEWSKLVESLRDRPSEPRLNGEDSFSAPEGVPDEFVQSANACLLFARARPDLLRSLSKNDIGVVVERGSPFLFNNSLDSMRRMRSFLDNNDSDVLESERAQTVDLMRYLLSYACNSLVASYQDSNNRELVETSVRNLLNELVNANGTINKTNFAEPILRQSVGSQPLGQNIEMKKGDWICLKCSFMNFGRNMKCLECSEERPKRQLTGVEWECPQCDFYNYGRNIVCLRCDCKRPGDIPLANATARTHFGPSQRPSILNGNNSDRSEIKQSLVASDEKAERWFSKASQIDGTADLSSTTADEDFPEIMPLRKGVNRFVVSNRKTPLERRLDSTQLRNSGNDGSPEGIDYQAGDSGGSVSDRTRESSISERLDRILGRSQTSADKESSSSNKEDSVAMGAGDSVLSEKPESPIKNKNIGESESWSKKVAELDNERESRDLTSTTGDDDFPDIMPIRKGENRFVVSKKKDRSLTSPQYKKRMAMEQANNNSNYVPFVPFPPGYFAKKDKPLENSMQNKTTPKTPPVSASAGDLNNQFYSENNLNEKKVDSSYRVAENTTQQLSNNNRESTSNSTDGVWKGGFTGKSLEGSAVKEPDPLDMSEEAKAERWFRRVAQIKDISELSQIPDEDFPEIMPMRKGVNRFVVSKRKTPLERRLTSPQYRRNLPVVNSDLDKDIPRD
ncbi:hypothetical protein QJS10_CPB17g01525 [Acorus calamus]|uniref:RanBP2-type domain-containing protein n=1 Tax=Acorus calamus TaxID=4465 RepID=A0AAV9CWV0_ACOCL|nr:hypothetical protein QJS10_CPB17g01525 [Acorus calamus]